MAQDNDLDLSFAIVQLKDRTDPDAELWESSDESDSFMNRYFFADQLITGEYKLLIPPELNNSFNTGSKTAEICGVSHEQLDQEGTELVFTEHERILAVAVPDSMQFTASLFICLIAQSFLHRKVRPDSGRTVLQDRKLILIRQLANRSSN